MRFLAGICTVGIALSASCLAQNVTSHAGETESVFPFRLAPQLTRSHNSTDVLRHELLDTNTILLITLSAGINSNGMVGFRLEPGFSDDSVNLIVSSNMDRKACDSFGERLTYYIDARRNGHTREFLTASLGDKRDMASVSDPDLRSLLKNQPLLPAGWLKKGDAGVTTNKDGSVARMYVPFSLLDDGINWQYEIYYFPDKSFDRIAMLKYDAKDSDPKYKAVMKEVNHEVEEEIQKQGISGKIGAVPTFMMLKKQKLRERGIEWQSVEDLNPGASFD
jgi:hypothetical protein